MKNLIDQFDDRIAMYVECFGLKCSMIAMYVECFGLKPNCFLFNIVFLFIQSIHLLKTSLSNILEKQGNTETGR